MFREEERQPTLNQEERESLDEKSQLYTRWGKVTKELGDDNLGELARTSAIGTQGITRTVRRTNRSANGIQ
jgi:hypothetical protein